MDVRHINPFLVAVQEVFDTMINIPFKLGKPTIKKSVTPLYAISGIIGMSGAVTGCVVINLSEETAYKITKAFWENRATWEQAHPAMKFINMDDVNFMGAKLHPGALKYYEEIGYKVADSMK